MMQEPTKSTLFTYCPFRQTKCGRATKTANPAVLQLQLRQETAFIKRLSNFAQA